MAAGEIVGELGRGLLRQAGGELIVDRYGLWSGSSKFTVPPGRVDLIPELNSAHPMVNFVFVERQRLVMERGFWVVYIDYTGCKDEETEPVYEFNPGTGTEPIETHENFVATLAGKPSAPLNGAIFVDPNGEISSDDEIAVFQRFREVVDGAHNELAGAASFIAGTNSSWTKTWTRKSAPAAGSNFVRIDNPPGNPPDFGGSYNWLYLGTQYTKRARVYACQARWLLSGPKGWSTKIYAGG